MCKEEYFTGSWVYERPKLSEVRSPEPIERRPLLRLDEHLQYLSEDFASNRGIGGFGFLMGRL